MRLIAIAALALLAVPAFAQQPKNPENLAAPMGAPPPEGFYRGIPNAYDLLARARPVEPVNIDLYCRFSPQPGLSPEELDKAKEDFMACRRAFERELQEKRGRGPERLIPRRRLPPR